MPIDLDDHAHSITSQSGENGIIDAIFDEIGTANEFCVEFGAYHLEQLSNVFPLWAEEGWEALLIEGDPELSSQIQRELRQDHLEATDRVTVLQREVGLSGEDSLDAILEEQDAPTDLDLVSIDVDGMDYHIWENLSTFHPRVVVIEFNCTIVPWLTVIGSEEGNNVGASLPAVRDLGNSKGYDMIAATTNNAIFVREEESRAFANPNDISKRYDYEKFSRSLQYAGRTLDDEIFFEGPPLLGDGFRFAKQESTAIRGDDDLYFAETPPSPEDLLDYYLAYPLAYFLTHPKFIETVSPVLDGLGLKSTFRPIYRRLQQYGDNWR